MARIINKPVDVTMGPGGPPVSFRFNGGRERVREVLDTWVESGRWWEQEPEQVAYRVATWNGGVFELTFIPREKRWILYKAYD
jgi:hypothetical protein